MGLDFKRGEVDRKTGPRSRTGKAVSKRTKMSVSMSSIEIKLHALGLKVPKFEASSLISPRMSVRAEERPGALFAKYCKAPCESQWEIWR